MRSKALGKSLPIVSEVTKLSYFQKNLSEGHSGLSYFRFRLEQNVIFHLRRCYKRLFPAHYLIFGGGVALKPVR